MARKRWRGSEWVREGRRLAEKGSEKGPREGQKNAKGSEKVIEGSEYRQKEIESRKDMSKEEKQLIFI